MIGEESLALTPAAGAPVIRHRRRDPVFVIGHGRSGTSILTALVRKYLRVAFGTESQFFVRYHQRLARYGDLAHETSLRLLVRDLAGERFFQRSRKYGLQLDHERVVRDAHPRTYAGVLAAIFAQVAESQQMERWGDKTPEYSRHVPLLRSLFPTAQFIHVIRDGRDVALSGFDVHFGAKNAYQAAVHWTEVVTSVRDATAGLPPAAFLEVRYEDLLRTPAAVFERLIRFLDIEDADGSVTAAIGRMAAAELRSDNCGKWKQQLSQRQQELFAAVAGERLRDYGYDVPAPLPRRPGAAARCYWRADDAVRRLAMGAYWRDNFYKAGVRLRTCTLPMRRWRLGGGTIDETRTVSR